MTSSDGATWQPLAAALLGRRCRTGAKAGYTRNSDGSFDIQTTSGGFFALLPEVTRPPAPAGLDGALLARAARALAGRSRPAASGAAVSYQVTLGQQAAARDPGPDDRGRRARSTTPRRASTA